MSALGTKRSCRLILLTTVIGGTPDFTRTSDTAHAIKAWYHPRIASVWPLEGHMAIHIRRREFIVALGGVATARAALTVSGPALGQDYPNRQITILVGIAAGGITDVTTRQYAALLSK